MRQVRILLSIFILLGLFVLNSCGGGGNSTNSNGAFNNSTVKPQLTEKDLATINSTDDTNISFTIKNQSDHKISYLIIKAEDGLEIYNGKFSCEVNKACNIKIDKQKINRNLTFELAADNNKIVSASLWLYSAGNNFKIYANDTMLGIYLFNQMKHQNNLSTHNAEELAAGLIKLFKVDDFFEGLVIDYKINVIDGGLEKEQFYNKLEAEIVSEVLPINELNPIEHLNHLIVTPASGKSNCQRPGIGNALGVISNIGRLIPSPLGLTTSIIFGLGQTITDEACRNDSIEKSISDLNNRIDEIDLKIDALEYGLKDIRNIIDDNAIQTILNNFDYRANSIVKNINVSQYLGIYSTDDHENEYTDLVDFAKKNGGVKKVYEENAAFQNVLNSTGKYINDYDALISTNELSQLSLHLENLCRDKNKIAGEIIRRRIKCDLIITTLVTKANIMATETKLMLHDIINTTLLVQNDSGELDNEWLIKKGIKFDYNKSWQGAHEIADSKINIKLKDIESALVGEEGKKIFDPLEGFPTELSNKMKEHQCFSINFFTNPQTGFPAINYVPNVLEFYVNTPNNKPYIVTNCYNSKKNVKSIYYLDGGNNVANILGMLVPFNFEISMNSNYWPNKFSGAPLNITVPETSSGMSTAVFHLHSEHPTGLNSETVRVFGYDGQPLNQPHIPYLNVVRDGQEYFPVYPAYRVGLGNQRSFKPLASLEGTSGRIFYSTFLQPNNKNSNTDFTSVIYNGKYAELNETVYLSIEKEGLTYSFGLSILNTGHSGKTWPWSDYSGGRENIRLVCLSNTQCHGVSTNSHTIQWWDGTYISLHQQSPKDIILYSGPASVNP